ncbi:MAG TPA: START domain-containing protein [Flavipsychrobacter sp.]|nr:START domain-containing protein [Flavipsychrobacter sp.]
MQFKSFIAQKTKVVVAGLFMMVFLVTPCLAENFIFIKKQNGIRLYERELFYQDKKVREVKAEFLLNAKPEDVVRLIKDEKRISSWNKRIDKYQIVKGAQPSTWMAYTRFDLPFPFDDQETLLLYSISEMQQESWNIQFSSITSKAFPQTRSVSRVNHVKGSWLLENAGDNQLKITYRILSERKDEIPKVISDPIIRDNLLSSLYRMKTILEN